MAHDGGTSIAGYVLSIVIGSVIDDDDEVDPLNGAGGTDRRSNRVRLVFCRNHHGYAARGIGTHVTSLAGCER